MKKKTKITYIKVDQDSGGKSHRLKIETGKEIYKKFDNQKYIIRRKLNDGNMQLK